MGFRFSFPRIRGRSYGANSTAKPPRVDPSNAGAARVARGRTLPVRGSQHDEISAPASERRIDADAYAPGRAYMGRTEDTLNTGRPPNRIDRGTTARDRGVIGRSVNGWPYDGTALFVPHLIIPRRPITVTPFQRTIDTSVTVSTAPIGGPIS